MRSIILNKPKEQNISESDKRYRTIFEESPTALIEIDFIEAIEYFNFLREMGIRDLKKYLKNNIKAVLNCVKKIKIVDINKAAVYLYRAKSKNDFIKRINKVFIKESYESLGKGIIAIAQGKRKFEIELANKTLSGEKIYSLIKCIILPNNENIYSKALISISDITLNKETEEKKQQNEIKYYSLFHNSLDGIYISTMDGKYINANPALIKILGYSNKKELLSINIPKQLYVSAKDRPPPHKRTKPFETRLKKKDGTIIWVEISSTVIYERGTPIFYQGIVRDITKRKEAENEIKYLSFHDKLTGMYNRAYFEEELKRLDTKRQLPLSFIIGDVNGLKLVNDTYGHETGDRLLIQISKILKSCFRDEDITSRWGGDEFITILPSTNMRDALKIARRIKEICKKKSTKALPLSISLGVSTKIDNNKSTDTIIKEAEDKMYEYKLTERQDVHSLIISSLDKNLLKKGYETAEHIRRMRDRVAELGESLKLDKDKIHELKMLATLHDIGKITLTDILVFKPGELNPEEWKEIRRHPEIGYNIAQTSSEFRSIAEGILYHHERWDGRGYPKGIKKDDIPLTSRIISIVDAYDAMTNDRPYRKSISKKQAINELKRNSGFQFDPFILKKFISILEKKDSSG